MIDHFAVGHRKKVRGHLDDRRLHPEPPEGGGILEAIHAAAQDDERSGQVIEFVKGFVGEIVDAGKPRDLRDEGGRARGDDELPGGKGLAPAWMRCASTKAAWADIMRMPIRSKVSGRSFS